eukprot:1296531-Amphidinium_carterae.1
MKFPGSAAFSPVVPLLEESSTRASSPSLEALVAMQCHIDTGVDVAIVHLSDSDINQFLAEELRSLRAGLQDACKQAQVEGTAIIFTDTDGDMVEMRFEQGHINQYVNGRVSVSNLQAFNVDKTHRTYQDDGGCGTFRPEEDLDDIISRRDRLFATAARITTMPHVECPWGNLATMARLCLVLHHCGEVCTQTETALNYVESMLWKQLVAAIGKEVGPSDFSEYMIFHMRRLFKPAYLPTAFSVPVRRSCKHTPDGT